ncbi:MAG: DMT family transporter [Candidatus Aminicenantes bacterium]|nr:DMT family transporter [Candidatus Aminicenantes bacterium]
MAENKKIAGYMFASLSAISVSLVYITSKIIQTTMATNIFLFWWFGLASIWGGVILIVKREDIVCYIGKLNKFKLFFIYFVISEAFAAFIFFYVIKQINPAVVSFLGSITPLVVAVIAYFYIDEKLSPTEILGGFISVSGVVLITYVSPDIGIKYTLLVLLIVLIYSFNNVLIKKKTEDVPPILITLVRIFFLFITYIIYNLSIGGLRLPESNELIYLIAGSLLGPIFGMFFLFTALKHIKSTQVSFIKNSQPFLVVVFSYIFLGTGVTISQLGAGSLIIIGISLMISDRRLGIRTLLNRFIKN